MRVVAEHGHYLIRWGAPPAGPVAHPGGPSITVTDTALVIGTFNNSANVSVYSSEPGEQEPEMLDLEAWDQVLQTQFTAPGPLRVCSPDGTPPVDDEPWLTNAPGRWNIRIYARKDGFFADEAPGPAEDNLVELWQATP